MHSHTVARWLSSVAVLIVIVAAGAMWSATAQHRDLANRASAMTGGDPERGRGLMQSKGCAGCHDIPGVEAANSTVGPPLTAFSRRVFIAGVLSNTPDHLHQWLLNPPAIDPKTAMPNVGLSDQQARDAAAFLYTLN